MSARDDAEPEKRAADDPEAFAKAWPFKPVPALSATLYCLHCERAMTVGELRLIWEEGQFGLPSQYLAMCAFSDCDGSALDLGDEPWGELHKDA